MFIKDNNIPKFHSQINEEQIKCDKYLLPFGSESFLFLPLYYMKLSRLKYM